MKMEMSILLEQIDQAIKDLSGDVSLSTESFPEIDWEFEMSIGVTVEEAAREALGQNDIPVRE